MTRFKNHVCPKCGAKQKYPEQHNLVVKVRCVVCGYVNNLSFLLEGK